MPNLKTRQSGGGEQPERPSCGAVEVGSVRGLQAGADGEREEREQHDEPPGVDIGSDVARDIVSYA